jgi:ABC-2 type transport system permease protein
MKQAWVVAKKELSAYFGSPMALIFIGAFLVVTLFSFFWVESFFVRNIADVRPLFQWMPVLVIFLVAALTMRQWSEEQRGGTLELLLTLPVRRVELVLGKFMAVMILVGLALALTLFLPITVSILGPLDWGPVVGGYLAALLMAAAYAAIGLFVSSRTDNQIVSLIATVFVGGAFYLIGSAAATGLVGESVAEILRGIGTGSRFESIERGVIDLRDLLYYLSLTTLFLGLNVVSLDAKRWSKSSHTAAYRRQVMLTVVLVVANLVALNTWLFPLGGLRADLTAGKEYSLSPVTKDLIQNLQEPLLIRGYISEKTHPLLAPLVPTIRDMLREYQIASGGKIQAEVVDPRSDPDLEKEANEVYGIQPSPFRVTGRYEASVINSYFDILIRYGDQHEVLSFSDLIEVEQSPSGQVDVRLRNLEYDLTRSIKKVVYGFQSLGAVFASIQDPIKLTAFITPGSLPTGLEDVPQIVDKVGQDMETESGGKLTYQQIDPDAAGSPISRQTLINSYGLQPIPVSLFSADSYYLDLVLQIGDQAQLLYPSGDMTEADIRSEVESALKRVAPGFLKTVGVWVPDLQPVQNVYGGTSQPISSWNMIQQQLSQDYTIRRVDLSTGRVPGDIDVLLLIEPQGMGDKELFAIDQYLMRGGAVVVAGGAYALSQQQMPTGLTVDQLDGGLKDLLASYGVNLGDSMVLDPQNEPFPVQVQRQVGGMQVMEIQQLDYPFFVDVRSDGMAKGNAIVSNLPAVTMHWVSPVEVDETKNAGREVTVLLKSTDKSWLRSSPDVQPNTDAYPPYGFPIEGDQASVPLAVAIHGSFESYFKDRASPFEAEATTPVTGTVEPPMGTVTVSPDSARLVVIGSAEFIDDAVLQISQGLSADRYLNNLEFMQNAVDWSVEDEDLLTIRTRGTYARLLEPLEQGQQTMWEGMNYAVALIALVVIAGVWNIRRRSEQPMELVDDVPSKRREGGRKHAAPRRRASHQGGSHE